MAKSTLLTSTLGPLGSFKICLDAKERVGYRKHWMLPHLFIPSKTATFVSEFVVEDLPLDRTATLVPPFAVKEHSVDIILYYILYYIIIIGVFCQRAGPSVQAQEPRLQFCRRQIFHRKLRTKAAVLPEIEQIWQLPVAFRNIFYYHQSVLPKGRYFTANAGTKVAVLFKGRSSTAYSGTKVAVLLGMNRCGGFPCFPHSTLSLASIQTLKI